MPDTRRKNIDWTLEASPKPPGMDGARLAVLMDIRDELQTLNGILNCRNFLRIPYVLDEIKRNTTKRKYNRKKVTP